MKARFKIWEGAALAALCVTLLSACWAQGRQAELEANVIRLHVVAVSDAQEEQALKLRVRDAVLDYLEPRLADVTERDEARERLLSDLDAIADAAASASEGRTVQVSLGPAAYPLTSFEGGTLPAGTYESLRVILGKGEGHNWWGLLFPQLALPAAEGGTMREAVALDSFSLVSDREGYEIRFRVVELWGEAKNWLGNRLR